VEKLKELIPAKAIRRFRIQAVDRQPHHRPSETISARSARIAGQLLSNLPKKKLFEAGQGRSAEGGWVRWYLSISIFILNQ